MASESNNVTIGCPHCKQSYPYTYWYKIDGTDSPHLKQKILDGTLFVAVCPHCSTKHIIMPTIRYADYVDKNVFIYLVDHEHMESSRDFIESLPLLKANKTRIHIVHRITDLQTHIALYDKGVQPPETIIVPSKSGAELNERIDKVLKDFNSDFLHGKNPKNVIDTAKKASSKPKRSILSWLFRGNA